jgi:hypothetical protein
MPGPYRCMLGLERANGLEPSTLCLGSIGSRRKVRLTLALSSDSDGRSPVCCTRRAREHPDAQALRGRHCASAVRRASRAYRCS